jgi:hypothetical protein
LDLLGVSEFPIIGRQEPVSKIHSGTVSEIYISFFESHHHILEYLADSFFSVQHLDIGPISI